MMEKFTRNMHKDEEKIYKKNIKLLKENLQ